MIKQFDLLRRQSNHIWVYESFNIYKNGQTKVRNRQCLKNRNFNFYSAFMKLIPHKISKYMKEFDNWYI